MRNGAERWDPARVVPVHSDRSSERARRGRRGERRRRPSIRTRWSPRSGRRRSCPISKQKAGPFLEVRDLAAKSPDEAGAKCGYRAKSEDTPWTLMVQPRGNVIVAADTESRAATIGVDATGDRQDRRDRADRPGDARHCDPRCARFRLVQRLHQPDRLRPVRQGVQHLRQSQHARKAAARRPGRAQGRRCSAPIRSSRRPNRRW